LIAQFNTQKEEEGRFQTFYDAGHLVNHSKHASAVLSHGKTKTNLKPKPGHKRNAKSIPQQSAISQKTPQLERSTTVFSVQDVFAVDYTRDRKKFDKRKKMLENLAKESIIL